MNINQATRILERQYSGFKKLDNTRYAAGGYEYRLRFEGGFAAFFAIERRPLGRRNFKYAGGFSAASMTNEEVINRFVTAIKRPTHCGFEAEPPFPVKPLPAGTTFINNPDGTVTPVYPTK